MIKDMQIQILEVTQNKKQYLDLLLLADEQESMIDKYLEDGTLYIMKKSEDVIGVCVVLQVSETEIEVKNLAISEIMQGKGYGKKFLSFIEKQYRGQAEWLILGTGDSPLTIPFYEKCGFVQYKRIKNFFLDNYDHLIIEDGVTLVDMIYLRKAL